MCLVRTDASLCDPESGTIGAGRMSWSYDEWLWLGRWVRLGVWEGSGLGGAVFVWCWDSVGKAVDVPS